MRTAAEYREPPPHVRQGAAWSSGTSAVKGGQPGAASPRASLPIAVPVGGTVSVSAGTCTVVLAQVLNVRFWEAAEQLAGSSATRSWAVPVGCKQPTGAATATTRPGGTVRLRVVQPQPG